MFLKEESQNLYQFWKRFNAMLTTYAESLDFNLR